MGKKAREGASAGPSQPAPKFGQQLASNDKATRDKAVKALTKFLKTGCVMEEIELAKIWKALFYCMWHSDKPKVQTDLAQRMGGLVHAVPGSRATLFAKVFWATMMREWPGIDRLRLNKFYMLLRCMLENSVRQLRLANWPAGGAEAFAQMLWLGPLSPGSPVSLRYWLVDTMLPVLKAELKTDTAADVWLALIDPFFRALGAAPDAHSLKRTTEGVVDALLAMGEALGEDEAADDGGDTGDAEAPPGLPIELSRLADRLFVVASDKSTREANRQQLYALQEKVEGLARKAGVAAAPPAATTACIPKAAAPAPTADPEQVSALRKLIGAKAGGAKAGGPKAGGAKAELVAHSTTAGKKPAKAAATTTKPTKKIAKKSKTPTR